MNVLLVGIESVVNKKTGEFYGYDATVLTDVANFGSIKKETQHIRLDEEQYNFLKDKLNKTIKIEFIPTYLKQGSHLAIIEFDKVKI